MSEIKYTEKVVYSTLKNRPSIEAKIPYSATLDGINTLIDMDLLLEQAKLTDYQAVIFDLYYRQGYQMHEIAKMLGVKHHTNISMAISNAKRKIKRILIKWGEI
ncbi:hypothetical protein [Romboutsia ilealis]|uniref:hypothetical protein n=1 Tax=Romboutsia ilealis TaxID=1115758 RepID=UPI0026F3E2B9|nr:hypothetical protein [Romboutsia ilealis]